LPIQVARDLTTKRGDAARRRGTHASTLVINAVSDNEALHFLRDHRDSTFETV
jgi:hypothetical protein